MKCVYNGKQSLSRYAGVTIIETVVSMLILSGAMVAALNAVTGARASHFMVGERAKARLLAETMLAEVLAMDYMEPGSTTLGSDGGESDPHQRDQFDDVDDFDGWSNSVREPGGSPIPGFESYELEFRVEWVDAGAPGTVVASDSGAKRIIVTITRNSKVVFELHGWASAP